MNTAANLLEASNAIGAPADVLSDGHAQCKDFVKAATRARTELNSMILGHVKGGGGSTPHTACQRDKDFPSWKFSLSHTRQLGR